MNGYADNADCGRCGKSVHLLHDAPCPHGEVACPECGHAAVCRDCRHIAELEDAVAANPWPLHDLGEPVTRAAAIERQTEYLRRVAAEQAEVKRTYDEAQARYVEWTQQKGQGA